MERHCYEIINLLNIFFSFWIQHKIVQILGASSTIYLGMPTPTYRGVYILGFSVCLMFVRRLQITFFLFEKESSGHIFDIYI